MGCDYYRILFNDIVIAERMTLETACLLVKALFEHFWKEPSCQYTIEKMAEEDTDFYTKGHLHLGYAEEGE